MGKINRAKERNQLINQVSEQVFAINQAIHEELEAGNYDLVGQLVRTKTFLIDEYQNLVQFDNIQSI